MEVSNFHYRTVHYNLECSVKSTKPELDLSNDWLSQGQWLTSLKYTHFRLFATPKKQQQKHRLTSEWRYFQQTHESSDVIAVTSATTILTSLALNKPRQLLLLQLLLLLLVRLFHNTPGGAWQQPTCCCDCPFPPHQRYHQHSGASVVCA